MSAAPARTLVGSETQAYEREVSVSGWPRVMREAHTGLLGALAPWGMEVVPVHTRGTDPPGQTIGRRDEYLSGDPLLSGPARTVDDVDLLLMLGLNMTTDFSRILRRRRARPLPTIALVHDILPLLHPEWFLPKAREHYRAYLQQLLHVTDHVVVTTDDVRSGLLGLGWRIPGTIHTIPLGSCIPQQPPTSAPRLPLSLLYVSTVAPRKGHRLLLDAFDDIRSRGVDVELTLIGRLGWMADDLADAIVHHPQFGRTLHWRRTASDEEIVDTARRCSVAVVPAESEGYGLFLDEALTLGLPCVARDIPVFRERAYPNLLLAEGTATAFADAMLDAGPPTTLPPGTIRSMDDFSRELADLVRSVLR